MRKAPIVNLNTAALIKELVGEYNEDTQQLIHNIALHEQDILEFCNTMADYKIEMQKFIDDNS